MGRVLIVAELSANHNQDKNTALKTIKTMKESGADAVKIQTFKPDTITIDCDNDYFKIKNNIWSGQTLYKLYQKAYMPWEWQKDLKEYAENLGLIFFSTPFDFTAVDFLEKLNVPFYKISSYEITDIPLIKYIASKNKPIIISTGIATLKDIKEAINACRKMKNNNITLLKCVSSYPAKPEDYNLYDIITLKNIFKVDVGLSDHSLSNDLPLVATVLGAKIIEKHFTLKRKKNDIDSSFSLEPKEFKNMVKSIREIEKSFKKKYYRLPEKSKEQRNFRRSLFIIKDIKKNEILTNENVKSIRPGYGLHPKYLDKILGKKVNRDIEKGTPLHFKMIYK